jgi:two-component system cell cycle sensor histidine kinase/response regulator CckA
MTETDGAGAIGVGAKAHQSRHSLRWRLPVLFSGLIALVVATFLWAAYRQLEDTLLHEGAGHALTAAAQVGALLAQSAQQRLDVVGRAAADGAVREYLEAPTESARQRVRERLASLISSDLQTVDLWNQRGERVLRVVSTETGTSVEGARAAPLRAGLSGIQASGNAAFYDFVAEVRGSQSAQDGGRVLLGRVVVRRLLFSPATRDFLNSLLGGGGTIKIGNRNGGAWSDMVTLVPAPPVEVTMSAATGFQGTAGDPRIAAIAPIDRTPWAVWVEFPRTAILAPARAFLVRMVLVALAVMTIAAVLAYVSTTRITTPLSALTQAAEAIASGDYSSRVAVNRQDEIGRLGDAFNTMTSEVSRELTARKAAERALRDREASFRALFADNPLPMWLFDVATLHFLEVNDAAVKHYGYSREEFLAMRVTDLLPGEDLSRLPPDPERTGSRADRSSRWRHRTKSGQIVVVDITSNALCFEGRSAELVVAQDVSERERLEAQLRQASKMEAVGQLAGGVAHDFNNLLTAIIGYSNLTLEALEPAHPVRADIQEIQKAGESAASLTRQLLAFSRKQILQPQILDLNAVVTRVEALLQRLIGADIELVSRLAPSIDRVNADPGQMAQIIMNLSVNARDAMPRGGKLTIETANVDLDEGYAAAHPGASVGRHVMLAVSDTGTGMDDETQMHIFEPFFTTKHASEGTGLGLATVYGIVKQSGGSIWVYSELGHGTTFKVYLPHATQPRDESVVDVARSPQGGTETILLAEDQPEVGAVTSAMLTRRGYTVLLAGGGDEALRLAREYRQPIHLLLTDVVMPSMNGRDLFTRVHALRPEIRVLYASGYTDNAIVLHGVLEQGVAFIQKPFTPHRLLKVVRDVLDAPVPAASV